MSVDNILKRAGFHSPDQVKEHLASIPSSVDGVIGSRKFIHAPSSRLVNALLYQGINHVTPLMPGEVNTGRAWRCPTNEVRNYEGGYCE